jgi:ABC-type branched-subunit amino acid transport system substrate-binding protein
MNGIVRRMAFVMAASLTAIVSSQAQQKDYGPGVTDAEIKIGNIMPYSGPGSALSMVGRVEEAYFKKINDEGGINGRKINFISYDDALSPPKTMEQARKLVENDEVFLLFGTIGTAPNVAIQKYLNSKGVPHLFIISGASRWADQNYPWSIGWYPSYFGIGNLYGQFVAKNYPNAKIGVIGQGDDSSKDYVRGFKQGLGESGTIVAERGTDPTDPTIDSQIVFLKSSGAGVLVSFLGPRQAVQSAKKVKEMGWKPVYIQAGAASHLATTLEYADGVITDAFVKEVSDGLWKDDPGVKDYVAFFDKYAPTIDKTNAQAIWGYSAAQAMVQVLTQCGDVLTRENVLKQALNLKSFAPPMFLPGIAMNTSPTNYHPILEERLVQYSPELKSWKPISDVMTMATD